MIRVTAETKLMLDDLVSDLRDYELRGPEPDGIQKHKV